MMADKTTPGGVLHDPVNGGRLDEPSAVNLDARLREVSTEAGDEADRAEAAAKDAAASAARAEAIVPGIEAEVRAVVLASPELKGEPGAPGPAPSIKIGTVTSGATPSATIKGTSPDLTLDLVLPQPAPGAVVDPYSIRGPGRPDMPSTTGGVITGSEPVGAEYRSTDGASVGAWTWTKRPGGTWEVTDGNTGWRRIGDLIATDPANAGNNPPRICRIGPVVYVQYASEVTTLSEYTLPAGFRPGGTAIDVSNDIRASGVSVHETAGITGRVMVLNGRLRFQPNSSRAWMKGGYNFAAEATWPSTLPGSPA